MKSSNPKVMINAIGCWSRAWMKKATDWNYPIHLGVTEAGEGEDGRIKSAIGIGSLLADGIGDTIRVSLTEDSIHEIPVAQALVRLVRPTETGIQNTALSYDPFSYQRRASQKISGNVAVGGEETVRVCRPAGDLRQDRAQDRSHGRLQAGDRLRTGRNR